MSPLDLEVTFNAPLEEVYNAFVSPEMLQRWFCPLGMVVQQAMSNSAVDGKFLIKLMDNLNNIHTLEGKYLEMMFNEKLVFTWQWLDEDHLTKVTITFSAMDEHTTLIHLVHSEFPDQEDYNLHYQAWVDCLEKLSLELSSPS